MKYGVGARARVVKLIVDRDAGRDYPRIYDQNGMGRMLSRNIDLRMTVM